ncbi:MAG: ATP-dependent DNA helicase RecQ [Deltaproteobacteria bacterium]|jgi:ATP-dependent DNA helicase RecQ|nr:ATP-dependent DNA helicase RecQ [Deltaproteobacteria bacterium]
MTSESSLDDSPLADSDGKRDTALADSLARLGHEAFRPGQREAIEGLLGERRLLLVAPTGGGKSLCYQLPALLLEGTTVVVSPLIALMRDQVDTLEQQGIEASFLASTLDPAEMGRRLDALEQGRLQLVYVAPERLVFPRFREILRGLDCPLFAIDEAHCISEWGHDFRPEYLEIGHVLAEHPEARVLACTATATPYVRDEILARLGLPADTPQIVRGFARPNLALRVAEVERATERRRIVDGVLAEALGDPGAGRGCAIVYGPTRKSTEAERDRLIGRGWRCESYHAGLTAERRESVHAAFAAGELEVVVATNAFGMGIDRPDVRAVIHLAPPGSIEAYYQEVGRAGRDGENAIGQMLLGPGDLARRRALIESDGSMEGSGGEAARHRWSLFLELMRFAEGGSCRHDAVLRYFGDEAETLAGCGRCDVCEGLAGGEASGNAESDGEVALLVRKALSGVARVHGRFGLGAAVALLRGETDARLANEGLDRTSTFGVLSDHSERWLTRLLRRCVTAGWVDFEGGDRPVVVLTPSGISVMRGERSVRLLLPPGEPAATRGGGQTASRERSFLVRRKGRNAQAAGGRGAAAPDESLDAEARTRFEALRAHRLEMAQTEGVPPYVVASDRSLRDLARLQPRSEHELTLAHGIGEAKARKYGAGFLEVLRRVEQALAES